MEKKRMSGRKKSCANKRIPDSVNQEFIERILNLPNNGEFPFKVIYLQEEFLSKFLSKDKDSANSRRDAAVEKWLKTEDMNAETNVKLLFTPSDYQILPRVSYERFVTWTRNFIEAIIGEVPPYEALFGGFSGGATTSKRRNESHPTLKYYGKAHATRPAYDIFMGLLRDIPVWYWTSFGYCRDTDFEPYESMGKLLELDVVDSNVMFTVDKTAEIDRCACKEPDINMYLQKGVGNHIRRRLKAYGINLNDQSINRKLAHAGSVDGSLSTIDLSSASDSITTVLVQELLPDLWYSLLDDLRCPSTIMFDGTVHRNEMFSSMGNGFTFELESLIFFALAKATARFTGHSGVISVYGDDIICPSALTHDLIWVLSYCGFKVNTKKSFWEGSFRESCGGHYESGRDVTPFYLKQPMGRLTDVIHMANSLRKWSLTSSGLNRLDTFETWSWLKAMIPEKYWGGRDYGDKTRLVTPDLPRMRLVARNSKPRHTGMGGYMLWLNSVDNRQLLNMENVVETSTRQDELQEYRARRVDEVTTNLADRYLEEI